MHLQLKMLGNGTKNIFRENQTTNKVEQTFFKVKTVTKKG